MDKFVVEGGRPLSGEITVSGSKNACLPMMTAALLADEPTVIHNAPHLRDVEWMRFLLGHLGAQVSFESNTMRVNPGGFDTDFVPYDIMRKMRASMYAMGPMIARLGRARISLPGGCAIGERPVDIHLRGFHALGCKIVLRHGYVHAAHGGLKGATVSMGGPRGSSVGATCNLLMTAALAEGETVLLEAAREPEVVQLGEMLVAMGANIQGLGTDTVRVRGRRKLRGVEISVIPDRIEASTFLIAGAMTGGDLVVRKVRPDHMAAVIQALRATGAEIDSDGDGNLRVRRPGRLHAHSIRTEVYPGFPTDVQAPFMALLALAKGDSVIEESIYMERFMHVPELRRLGANLRLEGATAFIHGSERLCGAPVMASDLRCGAALALATLAAQGPSEIRRGYHIDRGYEGLEAKLAAAGAQIARRPEKETAPEAEVDMPPEFPPELGFLPEPLGQPHPAT
jgi:UDP-N-acetylglucosamine 1-carboxyvinyltransferase